MWTVNVLYFALAVALNLWDTIPMRRIRARFTQRGAV
ncbi:Lipopolysaccharide export system permease protein lptF [Kluyvera cryocrescens]|nr:Lipopolysaccharide export system permease protein lptF [Kluyvera cryocrescens]